VKLLLDTNAYCAWKRGHAGIAERIRASEHVFLSAVVAGELLFGFRHGTRPEDNVRELHELLDRPWVSLVPVSLVTADRFGRIAASLRRKGRPIPTNDIWIAAHAMETGADLVTFDVHFSRIDGLVRVDPGPEEQPPA